jgi:uncharacterized membrane protein
MLIGASIRHFFNLRHAGRNVWAIPAAAAIALVALALVMRPESSAAPGPTGATVPFSRVREIVTARCVPCHSQNPSNSAFDSPPQGIAFDTAAEIRARAGQIRQQAVDTHVMPLGNATGMTERERDLLGAWIAQGAR